MMLFISDRKEGALLLKETRTSILRLEKFGEAVANNNKVSSIILSLEKFMKKNMSKVA